MNDNKPKVRLDDMSAIMSNPTPSRMTDFYANHRELLRLNDPVMAKRSKDGQAIREFLLKSCYFFCVGHKWNIVDFANEAGISVGEATKLARQYAALYRVTLGQTPPQPKSYKVSSSYMAALQERMAKNGK